MKRSILAPVLAISALMSAQGAQAQQACVEPADLNDTVTYALPILYDAVTVSCRSEFAESSFMTNEADAFVAQFRAEQDAAWPGALRLLSVFMAARADEDGGDNGMTDMILALPDEALRPFVDGMLQQVASDGLGSEIKPSTCNEIAEAMELISPLPTSNVSGLVTFIAQRADLDDPEICSVEAD